MDKLNILAIVGSLRRQSFNLQLAKITANIIGNKANFEILDHSDIPLFNQDIEYPAPKPVKRVREKVKNADAIWIFTPEYNYNIPGVLKNLLDWLSRPISDKERQVLWKKPVAISGITPGMTGTGIAQNDLLSLLSYANMDIMNIPRLTIPNAFSQLNEDGVLMLGESKVFLEKQVSAFIKFIETRKGLN